MSELINLIFLDFVDDSGLGKKMTILATKSESKADQDKIVKLKAFNSSYFYSFFFNNDVFQNMALNMLLLGNQKDYLKLTFVCYIMISYLAQDNLDTK